LKPEYVNAFELGYLRYFSSIVLTNSIFYKQTNNVINRIISVSDSGVSLMTFENLAKAESYGIEFILTGNILKWWNINGNFSYFKTIISGGANGELDNNSYNWSTKFMTSMSFPKIIDVQISYNYSGKILTAQGSLEPFQSMDIAMKKDFMQKKVSLSLRVSDIFNTMKFAYNSSGTGFITNFVRKKREQQDDNNNDNPSNDY
jgi:outer membrane receptor protein involved in Fe transport